MSGKKESNPKVRCTKDGIPLALGPFIAGIRRGDCQTVSLPVILTILYASRALNAGTQPDISPIVSPPSGVVLTEAKYSKDFWRSLGYLPSQKVPRATMWKKYHFTTKAGPNGHALWTSLSDLASLPETLLESLKVVGGVKFSSTVEVVKSMLPILAYVLPVKEGKIRKISYFPDKENKVRVIAILDYWSQTVLKGLHHYLFKVLKKIPQDCTFHQGSFKDKLMNSEVYYSADLTAATDRMPIQFISSVLKGKLPFHYVDHWVNIMVGYPFDYNGAQIQYAVGNPMGAYSSWASFAVAHHYLVYECCRDLGVEWKSLPYCLLGDDIVIGHKEVAELYLSKVRDLGVEVSMSKTHISPHLYEFAKRLVYKGTEITPFPISSLKETMTRYYLAVNLLLEEEIKGWVLKNSIPDALASMYGIILHRPSKFRKKIWDKSYISERIMKVMRGTMPAGDALNSISRQLGFRLPEINDTVAQAMLSNICVELFANSNPENDTSNKGYPLGQLAENLVLFLSGLEDENQCALGFENMHYIPHLNCYGLIEEQYILLKQEARNIDLFRNGDWPLLLRAMTIPLDDRVFVRRSSHLVPVASSIFGKLLMDRFKILEMYPQMLA
nr:MAG: putative RNA-dependent RNA polymerase [Mitoviridae sp.]